MQTVPPDALGLGTVTAGRFHNVLVNPRILDFLGMWIHFLVEAAKGIAVTPEIWVQSTLMPGHFNIGLSAEKSGLEGSFIKEAAEIGQNGRMSPVFIHGQASQILRQGHIY